MAQRQQIQLRRGTESEWSLAFAESVLASGEPGFVLDTNRLRIGDGENIWQDLEPIGTDEKLYKVRNETGSTLYGGQPVYASGVHGGDVITPALFVSDNSIPDYLFMGLVTSDINSNEFGFVSDFGKIYNVDTRGNVAGNIAVGDETWADGDLLYVHPTTAGKLTKVKPDHALLIAMIISAGTAGKLFVRPTFLPHLDDLHDVKTSGVANGQMLRYVSSSEVWTTGVIYDNGTQVGIGTSTPSYDLDVRTNSTNALYVTQGGGARYLAFGSSGFINNTTLAVSKTGWNNLGSLELSTTIASRRGVVVQQVASQTANAIETRDNSNNVLSYIGADGGGYFAGNVGIGTTSPSHKLTVDGASATAISIKTPWSVGAYGQLRFDTGTGSASIRSSVPGSSKLGLDFYTYSTTESVKMSILGDGNVGIGTTTPSYKLQVNGSFGATTKSFRIDHPSKPNYTLEYGSLESPYHGVRLTGRGKVVKGSGVVNLPPYLKDLIHDDETINIQITNIKHGKVIYVDKIDLNNSQFTVRADRCKTLGALEFFWTFTGTRKDVEHLVVEQEK